MSKKIVLIEDNPEMRENIQEILELADYEVHPAENGKAGVDMIKSVKPQLILCDIMMPELDGYGVLHMVSRNPDTAGIPFIFLTAKSEKEDFRTGMNMGADDYLTKPFDDVQLLDAVERRLNRIEKLSAEFSKSNKALDEFIDQVSEVASLEGLKDGKRTKKFKKKDTIYFEGDYAGFLYFINSGKVKTSKMNEDAKDLVTGLYKEGDFFGHMALIKEEPYEETAIALEDTEVSMVPKEDFIQLLNASKEVSHSFIKLLAQSVTENQNELLNLAYDTVRKRVADALLKLADKYKKENEDHFSMAISRDDLAAIVGTATESVIRTLSEFKADGYIAIKGSTITILNEDALKNFRF